MEIITANERQEVARVREARKQQISEIINFIKTTKGKVNVRNLKKLKLGTKVRENWENQFKGKEIKTIENELNSNIEYVNSLHRNCR